MADSRWQPLLFHGVGVDGFIFPACPILGGQRYFKIGGRIRLRGVKFVELYNSQFG